MDRAKVKDLASKKWGLTIGLRTAQEWLAKNNKNIHAFALPPVAEAHHSLI